VSDAKRKQKKVKAGIAGARFWLLWAALLCFGATLVLADHPAFVERYYSRMLYPRLANLLGAISDRFSFGLDHFLFIAIGVVLLVLFLFVIAGKLKWWKFLLITLNFGALLYVLFYGLWGFNYYRKPIDAQFQLKRDSVSVEDYGLVFKWLAEQQAEMDRLELDSVRGTLDSLVDEAFRNQADVLGLSYPTRKIKPKSMFAETFFSKRSVFGYYNPFFSEVYVSSMCQLIDYPIILAHEKAHRAGIARETDANFYAWFICYKSESDELRYCANLFLIRHLIDAGYGKEFLSKVEDEPAEDEDQEKNDREFGVLESDDFQAEAVHNEIDDYAKVIEPASRYLLQVEKIREKRKPPRKIKESRTFRAK